MAFFTRPELDNRQFKQVSGSTLTLSGNTEIVSGGTFTLHGKEIVATGGTLGQVLTLIAPNKIGFFNAGSGGGIYNGASPSTISVGGIPSNTNLAGKTYDQLFEQLLAPYVAPTITSFSVSPQNTIIEVGTSISGIRTFTWVYGTPSNISGGTIGIRNSSFNITVAKGLSPPTNSITTGVSTTTLFNNGDTNTWFVSGRSTNNTLITSNNFTVTARFLRFYGPTASTPANSSAVRGLPVSAFQTAAVNTFILNTGNVLTKFCVALPPGRTIASVIDLDALNANITANYVFVGTITVNDGGGSGTPRTYNLYEMNVGTPYSSSHQHQITTA